MVSWEKFTESVFILVWYMLKWYIQNDFGNDWLKTWRAKPPLGGSASRARVQCMEPANMFSERRIYV